MKKYLVLVLIGLMFLGLALSVLAANPHPAGTTSAGTGRVSQTIARMPIQEDLGSLRPDERSGVIALVVGRNRATMAFVRKIIGLSCWWTCSWDLLSWEQARAPHTGATSYRSISWFTLIGTLGYQRLIRFLTLNRELEEVCYG